MGLDVAIAGPNLAIVGLGLALANRSLLSREMQIASLFLGFERREQKSMVKPHILHPNLQKTFK